MQRATVVAQIHVPVQLDHLQSLSVWKAESAFGVGEELEREKSAHALTSNPSGRPRASPCAVTLAAFLHNFFFVLPFLQSVRRT